MFQLLYWISNIPSPYKVELFNLLGKQVELTCLFEDKNAHDREDSWFSYKFTHFNGIYITSQNKRTLLKQMAKENDLLINSDYTNPICMRATELFRKAKKPVILQADGGLVIPRGFLIDKAIGMVMKRCTHYLSSGKEVNKYFEYYGVQPNKIYNYRFSSLTQEDLIHHATLRQQKDQLKEKLQLKEKHILFSLGQQIPRKGYDLLAQAMVGQSSDIGGVIAGGQPEEVVKNIIDQHQLNNFHFIGFKSKEELAEYYAAADIFVFPTRYDIWGLVINEAMSFGLPIISTNKCVASLEFNLVKPTNMIVPVENVQALHTAIDTLVHDEKLQQELSQNSLDLIQNYTIDQSVEDLVHALQEIVSSH